MSDPVEARGAAARQAAAAADGRPALLVHEYVTGGGWPEAESPPFAGEADAMLRAVLEDLRVWGRFSVVTTRDRRIGGAAPAADRVVWLDGGDRPGYRAALLAITAGCAAALVIAPESGGALERVSRWLDEAGVTLLGSRPAAIAVAADKWECSRRFAGAGLATPETLRVAPRDAAAAVRRLGLPVVLKPPDGAGCDGVALVHAEADLAAALALPALAGAERILVQSWVAGEAASVSLLVAGRGAVPLSLNAQRLRVGIPCAYEGGTVAIEHRRRDEAFDLAARAVGLVPGLRGYVGVDLVLAPDGCFLVEINPRVTTSYVGLRRALAFNLAEAHWRACICDTLPTTVRFRALLQDTGEETPGRDAGGEAVPAHA
jgi:hypothetical protein